MLPNEEFLCGSGTTCAPPDTFSRWIRPTVQWFAVVLAHAAIAGVILQISPQARLLVNEVIQASLISPQAPPEVKPPEPKPPEPPARRPPRPPRPQAAPLVSATPSDETPPASFMVAEVPAEAVPVTHTAPVAPPPEVAPLVPPVFNADYLENPAPQYPSTSRRLGEKGRVLLRVFVSASGRAERVEIKTSSGFERLDLSAREAVVNWRFIPARRGDEKVAAWVLVPVSFVM